MKPERGIHPMIHLKVGPKVHSVPLEAGMHPGCSSRASTSYFTKEFSRLDRCGLLVVVLKAPAKLLPSLIGIKEGTKPIH